MIKIPKIIHQTWKDSILPDPYINLAETWKCFLPDWEYVLWTDEMNRDFVMKYFPDFLEKYDSYPKNIQRADAIRYLLLKKYGGLYVDLDFECLADIEILINQADFTAGKEPYCHAKRFGMPFIVCNAFMSSTPDNSFVNFLCDNLINYPDSTVNSSIDVLETTGPFLLTNSYNAYPHKEHIHILEPETIYPIGLFEVDNILNNTVTEEMADRINRAYAIHYFFGTW